jgi:hypothetical protein
VQIFDACAVDVDGGAIKAWGRPVSVGALVKLVYASASSGRILAYCTVDLAVKHVQSELNQSSWALLLG